MVAKSPLKTPEELIVLSSEQLNTYLTECVSEHFGSQGTVTFG